MTSPLGPSLLNTYTSSQIKNVLEKLTRIVLIFSSQIKLKKTKKKMLMYLFTTRYEKNKLEMEMFRGKINKNFCLNWSSHLYHEKDIIELKNVIQNFIQI